MKRSFSFQPLWNTLQTPLQLSMPAVRSSSIAGPPLLTSSMLPYLARLPGSNLLFGLPVVMDTEDKSIKEGSKVGMACPPRAVNQAAHLGLRGQRCG